MIKKNIIICTGLVGVSLLFYNNCSSFVAQDYATESGSSVTDTARNPAGDGTAPAGGGTTPIGGGTTPIVVDHFDQIQQLSSGKADTRHIEGFSNFINEEFKLFWHVPTRAYPGIDIDFQLIHYEVDNQAVAWKLIGAPAGMKISGSGHISWAPTEQQRGSHSFSVKLQRTDGKSITKDVTIKVNSSDFLFVSPDGSDSNPGSKQSPYKTIRHAMRQIVAKQGKTVYLSTGSYGGCHKKMYFNEEHVPLKGKGFTANSPFVLRGLPGDDPVIDCKRQGSGIVLGGTSYAVIKNLTVINVDDGDGGGIVVWSKNVVVQKVTVKKTRGDSRNNLTAFLVKATEVVIDRCRAEDNIDVDNPKYYNNSSFLFYTENGAVSNDSQQTNYGNIWALNNYSTGSNTGFKIKHAGSRKLILHNNVSEDDYIGFGFSSTHSSMRYNMAINSKFMGLNIGLVDTHYGGGVANSFSKGDVLVEHNLFYNKYEEGLSSRLTNSDEKVTSITISDGRARRVIFQKNIIYNDNDVKRSATVWPYDKSTVNLESNKNIYYFRNGSFNFYYNYKTYSGFDAWKSTFGGEQQSKLVKLKFRNIDDYDFELASNSPAILSNGEFAGPIKPAE